MDIVMNVQRTPVSVRPYYSVEIWCSGGMDNNNNNRAYTKPGVHCSCQILGDTSNTMMPLMGKAIQIQYGRAASMKHIMLLSSV
jgi:hypothetical protein